MPNEITGRLKGNDKHIVQHIPNIHDFRSSDSEAGNRQFLNMLITC